MQKIGGHTFRQSNLTSLRACLTIMRFRSVFQALFAQSSQQNAKLKSCLKNRMENHDLLNKLLMIIRHFVQAPNYVLDSDLLYNTLGEDIIQQKHSEKQISWKTNLLPPNPENCLIRLATPSRHCITRPAPARRMLTGSNNLFFSTISVIPMKCANLKSQRFWFTWRKTRIFRRLPKPKP